MPNVPDDWWDHYRVCDRCSHKYHASDGYCDNCQACEIDDCGELATAEYNGYPCCDNCLDALLGLEADNDC